MVEKKNKESRSKEKGTVGTHGRTFEGSVVKKFPHRVVVEFERTVFNQKIRKVLQEKNKTAC